MLRRAKQDLIRAEAVRGIGTDAMGSARRRIVLAAVVGIMGAAAHPAAAATVETRWTKAAQQAYVKAPAAVKMARKLPELRVYDQRGRLVLRSFGTKPGTLGPALDRALRAGRPVAGPSLAESLAELETKDGRPAAQLVDPKSGSVVVDYWAEWCAPCKLLGKELDDWAGRQPPSRVQIVRAETDLIAASRANGEKVYMLKKGPDGKFVKTEVK